MDYRELIKPRMSEHRFVHSCAVAERAKHLAIHWNADPEKAYIAGMVHDICKDISKDEQLKCITENGIIPDGILLSNPSLWHSLAGSLFLPTVGITDPDILSAVRFHTSARANMTLLEEIIYMADLTSADRVYDDIDYVRKLCEESLHDATFFALQFIVGDLARQSRPISQDTWQAYNYYLEITKNKE